MLGIRRHFHRSISELILPAHSDGCQKIALFFGGIERWISRTCYRLAATAPAAPDRPDKRESKHDHSKGYNYEDPKHYREYAFSIPETFVEFQSIQSDVALAGPDPIDVELYSPCDI
jgi:hypothetical protein